MGRPSSGHVDCRPVGGGGGGGGGGELADGVTGSPRVGLPKPAPARHCTGDIAGWSPATAPRGGVASAGGGGVTSARPGALRDNVVMWNLVSGGDGARWLVGDDVGGSGLLP